jgi:hypothetical protein
LYHHQRIQEEEEEGDDREVPAGAGPPESIVSGLTGMTQQTYFTNLSNQQTTVVGFRPRIEQGLGRMGDQGGLLPFPQNPRRDDNDNNNNNDGDDVV